MVITMAANVKVKLVRSLAGCQRFQKETARTLGLRKIGDVSVQPDNAATRGKITRISHLVATEEA